MAAPTVIDVAKRANVSKSTVSLVLNGNDRIPANTAAKVWAAVRELNYVPSRAARALQSGRSQLLGLIVSDITNPYFSELARSVSTAAGRHAYDLVTFDTDYDADLLSVHLHHLRAHRVDGLFIFTTERDLALLDDLRRAHLPAVVLNWGIATEGIGEIAVDYYSGMAALLDHLSGLGHRRISFISGPSRFYSAVAREEAFRHEVERRSDALEEPLYIQSDFRIGAEIDTAIADRIWRVPQSRRPTAVIASNDLMAINLLRAFHKRGVAVPDDISVTGVDDIVLSNYTIPSLTTLRLPRRLMGRMAFEILQELMSANGPQAGKRETVSMRLVQRESTHGPSF